LTDYKRRREMLPVGAAVDAAMAELNANLLDVDWDARDAEVAAERAREAEGARRKALEDRAFEMQDRTRGGFPGRAMAAALDPDLTAAPIQAIDRFGGDDRTIAVLSGANDCGKTVAACWWALTKTARAPRFVRAGTFAASSRYKRDDRAPLLDAGVLVLDDLGAEWSDAGGSFLTDLDELLDVFYGNRRHLIITTNVPATDFANRYHKRIAARIREAGRWFELGNAPGRRPAPRAKPTTPPNGSATR